MKNQISEDWIEELKADIRNQTIEEVVKLVDEMADCFFFDMEGADQEFVVYASALDALQKLACKIRGLK